MKFRFGCFAAVNFHSPIFSPKLGQDLDVTAMRLDVDPKGQMLDETNLRDRMISLSHDLTEARGMLARREVNPVRASRSTSLAAGPRRLTHRPRIDL